MGSPENYNKYSISTVIPAYNAAEHIARTIESVLAQSLQPDEIIVVDDGSTDGTADMVKKYGDKVRYIHQQNAGVSAARNAGIKAATSQWIAFLDADDEWMPEYIETQFQLLKNNPELSWASANHLCCLCGKQKIAPSNPIEKCAKLLNSNGCIDSYFNAFKERVTGCTDTMVIKKQALIEVGLFEVGLAIAEDLDLWLKVGYKYPKIGFTPTPMATYHICVPTSASHGEKPIQIFLDFIGRHLEIAEKNNRLDDFRPCAAFLIRTWIRGMLFDNRGKDIKLLLNKSAGLLPTTQRLFFNTLATFPKATAMGCRAISWVVRKLNLRKRAVRPPKANK